MTQVWEFAGESALSASKITAGPDRDHFFEGLNLIASRFRSETEFQCLAAEHFRELSPNFWLQFTWHLDSTNAKSLPFWISVAKRCGWEVNSEGVYPMEGADIFQWVGRGENGTPLTCLAPHRLTAELELAKQLPRGTLLDPYSVRKVDDQPLPPSKVIPPPIPHSEPKILKKKRPVELVGIEGWLLFWAIVLPINLLGILGNLIFVAVIANAPVTPESIDFGESETAGELATILISQIVIVAILIGAMIEFYAKKKSAIVWMKTLFGAALVLNFIAFLVTAGTSSPMPHNSANVIALIVKIIWSVVWFFYFHQSRRVRNTFTR